MIVRFNVLALLVFLSGCAGVPPKQIMSIGDPGFQIWTKKAYNKPASSFLYYQFHSASKGDKSAIESLFNQALYDARNPLLPGANEEARIWEMEAVLYSVGEERFLSILEKQYPEVQKAVLAPMDKRVLRGEFPKVSKLRAKFFSVP